MANVFVYWNFHKKVFSVRYKGRVIAHATRILAVDAEFKVSEAGRLRVLATGQKNVHAGIVCDFDDFYCDSIGCERSYEGFEWAPHCDYISESARHGGVPIRYSPYEGFFKVIGTGFRANTANVVYGRSNRLSGNPNLYADGVI